MSPLKILLTNNTLAYRAGSEVYVRDLALSLKRRGHQPMAYSQRLGVVSDELQAAGVTVYDDLARLSEPPDIIHGQHNLETMAALLRFPRVPGIFVCHGFLPWQEHPPLFPRILRYVAVDLACRDRLLQNGVPPEKSSVIFNFADLKRFLPRGPLPPVPKKALVFSNYAREDNYVPIIREACRRRAIDLDVAGLSCGRPCNEPEKLLPQYDLVFAKARSAIEALVVGSAVVTCDASGLGSIVNSGNLATLRELNFGFRTLTQPIQVELVEREIARYNSGDAVVVAVRMRSLADMETAVDEFLELYLTVLGEFRNSQSDRESEEHQAAAYLGWLSNLIKDHDAKQQATCDAARNENAALNFQLSNAQTESLRLRADLLRAQTRWNAGWPFRKR